MSISTQSSSVFDVDRIRCDFPILSMLVNGHPLIYLDNAATAQKPQCVIDAVAGFYQSHNANVHRGVHHLSETATFAYEDARSKVHRFINAESAQQIVFVRGTTEAINLVAASYGGKNFSDGDEVILSVLEHHANIVPWQLLQARTGIVLKVVPIDDQGMFLFDEFEKLFSPRTKFVALTHTSNALGTTVPVADVVRVAHAHGVPVLLDGCQGVVHETVDVQALDVDFYAFSGHKLYGPSGIGVLYGKADLLSAMPPYQGGGDMIKHVSFEKTTFADIPARFEAGTPPIADAIGLHAALDYIDAVGRDAIRAHEQSLLDYATERLQEINSVRLIGTAPEKASIVSFVLDEVHPHDVGTILDRAGIAVRVGHHCAQPIMERFGISGTIRASFGIYNTKSEVDVLVEALADVREIFG